MLKKVLCVLLALVTIISASAVTNVSAATVDVSAQGKLLYIGDVDLDGEINVMDASYLQRALAGIVALTEDQLRIATITGDEMCIGDVSEIQRYIAGYPNEYFIGESILTEEDNDDIFAYDKEYIENAIAEKFIEYINAEREAVGVQYLNVDDDLMKASKIRGKELVELFSHTRPDGSVCYTAVENGYKFCAMGENVAYHGGYVSLTNPDTIDAEIEYAAWKFYDQFKKSPGHYENMIRSYFNCHGVGVTIAVDSKYKMTACYVAHMFGETYD